MLRRAGELYCRGARSAPRHDAYAEDGSDWDVVLDGDGVDYVMDGIDVVLSCRAERALRERHNCPDHRRRPSERHSTSRRRRCLRRE
jgi:hypothetical protein